MQNVKITTLAVSEDQVSFNALSAGNALPPIKSFGDLVIESLFPEEYFNYNVLTPFDYEAFLRKEGYYER